MAMPIDSSARQYYRVAYQRFDDGDVLLVAQRWQASIYLTGYAVECMLKALLLASTPVGMRPAVLATFRGAIGHNIDSLRERLVQRIGRLPVEQNRRITLLSNWSTDLRYQAGPGDPDDARAFRDATQIILIWADGRM